MKITHAEYLKSFVDPSRIDLPPLPSFAFIGRSNVGKSSLINHLVGRKGLVKTSGTPGKTQMINFFLVNQAFYFVDLPGYGFATAPKAVKDGWTRMIWEFLETYPLSLIFQILDIRHLPSKEDQEFHHALVRAELPLALIGNKVDKLGKTGMESQAAVIKKALGFDRNLLLHSFLKKLGREEILAVIEPLLLPREDR